MNKEIWLWILLVMLPHNERTMQLYEHYGSAKAAAEAIRDEKCLNLANDERCRANKIRTRDVNNIIDECRANDIRIITIEDEEYPWLLKQIYNPPVVLFVQGTLSGIENYASLAVVGTRHPSSYAVDTAISICSELAALDVAIVSGLAEGIDSAAHFAALSKGARAIGVLACGNLVDYPSQSRELKRKIIGSGGAVISELLPNTPVSRSYFMHRNRIISGLAHGTFIVEAPKISGTHYTAEHAIEQGRELFCLPPMNVNSDQYNGVVRYLRDGATPVFGSVDIMNGLKYYIFHEVM